MKWFTRVRKNRVQAYPKAHICGITNQFETVALCWHAITADDVVWVDETYKGKTCATCEKINNGKKNKRRGHKR